MTFCWRCPVCRSTDTSRDRHDRPTCTGPAMGDGLHPPVLMSRDWRAENVAMAREAFRVK